MSTRRFIAGAVCPRCAEMDRLVIYEKAGEQYKECVECGYEEKQLAQVELRELDTRVNHGDEDAGESEPVQVLQFDPGKITRH